MRLFAGTPFDRPPTCERCHRLEAECQCPPIAAPAMDPTQQTVSLAIEKRKKGKRVTVVRGLEGRPEELQSLLVLLKNSCGAGGTLDDRVIEVQGTHVDRIAATLRERGFKVR